MLLAVGSEASAATGPRPGRVGEVGRRRTARCRRGATALPAATASCLLSALNATAAPPHPLAQDIRVAARRSSRFPVAHVPHRGAVLGAPAEHHADGGDEPPSGENARPCPGRSAPPRDAAGRREPDRLRGRRCRTGRTPRRRAPRIGPVGANARRGATRLRLPARVGLLQRLPGGRGRGARPSRRPSPPRPVGGERAASAGLPARRSVATSFTAALPPATTRYASRRGERQAADVRRAAAGGRRRRPAPSAESARRPTARRRQRRHRRRSRRGGQRQGCEAMPCRSRRRRGRAPAVGHRPASAKLGDGREQYFSRHRRGRGGAGGGPSPRGGPAARRARLRARCSRAATVPSGQPSSARPPPPASCRPGRTARPRRGAAPAAGPVPRRARPGVRRFSGTAAPRVAHPPGRAPARQDVHLPPPPPGRGHLRLVRRPHRHPVQPPADRARPGGPPGLRGRARGTRPGRRPPRRAGRRGCGGRRRGPSARAGGRARRTRPGRGVRRTGRRGRRRPAGPGPAPAGDARRGGGRHPAGRVAGTAAPARHPDMPPERAECCTTPAGVTEDAGNSRSPRVRSRARPIAERSTERYHAAR